MTDMFYNPITMSFELLRRYRQRLEHALEQQSLTPHAIAEIMSSVEVDRSVFFSLNRRYKTGEKGFRQFCVDHRLHELLPDALPYLETRRLYTHQERAIAAILDDQATIVSTGTGSGKTEAFLIPIIDHCLRHRDAGVKALVIYPMNALANDQVRRLQMATECVSDSQITFGLFTGATSTAKRDEIRDHPPDILITNYVMLDWMLTRSKDLGIFRASQNSLRYIVVDEIHTYRGNKATHLRYLLLRLKSHLAQPPVQIGTSATLQSDEVSGYLQSGKDRLDAFIKPLLNVETYTFVEPEYEPEPEEPSVVEQHYLPDAETDLDWALEVNPAAGLENIARLTGKRHPRIDLGADWIADAAFYHDLQQNSFVRALRRALIQNGAQSFVELVGLYAGLLPVTYPSQQVEKLLKAYLSAIAFANHHAAGSGPPLLDFRLHMFLHNVAGYLKRCIKCGKYHAGNQDHCQECGFPLFHVYRRDIHWCVGKVSGRRLKWELRPEADDRRDSYYVVVRTDHFTRDTEENTSLSFRDDSKVQEEEILLDYDSYGRLRLQLLGISSYRQIQEEILPLTDRTTSQEYLDSLVRAILDYQPRQSKKLLGFIDNREHASQYATVLQDDFASAYFEECLKLWLPAGRQIGVREALDILRRHLADLQDRSELDRALLNELDLWYWRNMGQSPRQARGREELLRLRAPEELTPLESEVAQVFLIERAIRKPVISSTATVYIKLEKEYATDNKGMHLGAGDGSSDPCFPSISLSDDATEYAEFVTAHGAGVIAQTVETLVQKGWLSRGTTPDGKMHYYLEPTRVLVNLPPSDWDDYEAIRERFLLTAAVHSSEIEDAHRRQVENRFQNGTLNFIMATPTLEMGIDIGKLQTVLMVGVPPLPSNYAQRAGRAGRSYNDQFALIVTFCSESSEHDSYYFHRPELMINGVITPPTFDPYNTAVVQKHIHAFVLAGYVDSHHTLQHLQSTLDAVLAQRLKKVQHVFDRETGAEVYLRGKFRGYVMKEIAEALSRAEPPQQTFYKDGFFPDYSFRRDQVYLIGENHVDGLGLTHHLPTDIALSEREPEIAYTKLVPDEIVFVGGSIYKVTAQGDYTTVEIDPSTRARSYRYLVASRAVRYAGRDKPLRKYDCRQVFENRVPFLDKRKIVGVAFTPSCRIRFANLGRMTNKGAEKFSDESAHFNLGYELQREAIVLRFDRLVCADQKLYLSLTSALDRAIKDRYGLDESELRLLVGVQPDPPDEPERPGLYVVLYEADGNGNVPLRRIFEEFDAVVEAAYEKMRNCPGSHGHVCDTGCYVCLRSYATHPYAASVDKATAMMFAGYLLGKAIFRPAIAEQEDHSSHFDLELSLERHGQVYSVRGRKGSYSASLDGEQNKVIFNLLTQAVQAEFVESMHALLIRASEDYIVNALNEGQIKKNKADFARLQFNLLRFTRVEATKERH